MGDGEKLRDLYNNYQVNTIRMSNAICNDFKDKVERCGFPYYLARNLGDNFRDWDYDSDKLTNDLNDSMNRCNLFVLKYVDTYMSENFGLFNIYNRSVNEYMYCVKDVDLSDVVDKGENLIDNKVDLYNMTYSKCVNDIYRTIRLDLLDKYESAALLYGGDVFDGFSDVFSADVGDSEKFLRDNDFMIDYVYNSGRNFLIEDKLDKEIDSVDNKITDDREFE